jgi:hypothetical protein
VKGGGASVMAMVFAFMGDTERADVTKIETDLWGPVERFTLEAKADAASKVKGIMPTEAIWTDVLQYRRPRSRTCGRWRGRDLLFMPAATALSPAPPPALRRRRPPDPVARGAHRAAARGRGRVGSQPSRSGRPDRTRTRAQPRSAWLGFEGWYDAAAVAALAN